MFFEDPRLRKIISRWIIGIVSVCVLIYLGVRHISQLAFAVSYVFSLIAPLCIGLFFALMLNLPMRFFERKAIHLDFKSAILLLAGKSR